MLFVMGEGWPEMPLQVNVKRGMLRLWLVLSIVWVAVAIPIAWTDLTHIRCAHEVSGERAWVESWQCEITPAQRRDPIREPIFDFHAAERAGINTTEIIAFLAPRVNFQLENARRAGGTDQQIYEFMRKRFESTITFTTTPDLDRHLSISRNNVEPDDLRNYTASHPSNTTELFKKLPYWPIVISALIFIVAPPIFIFIAGAAALWVSVGFRASGQ